MSKLMDETLKKIANELAEGLQKNITSHWEIWGCVRASLRLLVKRILRKYKYLDQQNETIELG